MLLSQTAWGQRETEQALSEGWMVFNDCEIQYDMEGDIFDNDDDAIEFVRKRAAEGSAMHQLALQVHDESLAEALAEQSQA